MVSVVENVVGLSLSEHVHLDTDRLNRLVHNLSQIEAEDVICRAVADLAAHISKCEPEPLDSSPQGLQDRLDRIRDLADQLGMTKLDRAAKNVQHCIAKSDRTATEATLARLVRIGDLSLCAVWDVEGLSV